MAERPSEKEKDKEKGRAETDLAETLVREVREHLTDQGGALTRRLADGQRERAKRLDADRARLAGTLGPDHPRVVALDTRLRLVSALASDLATAADDQACVEPTGARDWVVLGVVEDRGGRPLAGLRVQLVGDDQRPSRVRKPLTTDGLGRFRAVYHAADFADEVAAGLRVVVADEGGKEVFRSPETLEPLEGRFTSVTISLSAKVGRQGEAAGQCQARTAKGDQCRNPALAGSTFCSRHLDQS